MSRKINYRMSEEFLNGFPITLKKEKSFYIFPLGVFHLKTRKAQKRHNVATGKWEHRPAKKVIRFRPSQWLRAIIG